MTTMYDPNNPNPLDIPGFGSGYRVGNTPIGFGLGPGQIPFNTPPDLNANAAQAATFGVGLPPAPAGFGAGPNAVPIGQQLMPPKPTGGILGRLFGGDNDAGMQAALALLEAGGPSLTPVSLGQGLARAMRTGRTAQVQNRQNGIQEHMAQLQARMMQKQLNAPGVMQVSSGAKVFDPITGKTVLDNTAPSKPAAMPDTIDWQNRRRENYTKLDALEQAGVTSGVQVERLKKENNEYDLLIKEATTIRGTTANDPGGITNAVRTEMQKNIGAAEAALFLSRQVTKAYKPEFLTLQGKAEQGWNVLLDSVGLASKEQKQAITDYMEFSAPSYEQMNNYISKMTGAAMSEIEAVRLRKAIPDPQKDSPTQFAAKQVIFDRIVEETIDRSNRALRAGFNGPAYEYADLSTLGLTDDMPAIVGKDKGGMTQADKVKAMLGD